MTTRSTGPIRPTDPPNQPMKTSGGWLRIPVPLDMMCPKCGSENVGRKTHLWVVVDERGKHHECSVCAHAWS